MSNIPTKSSPSDKIRYLLGPPSRRIIHGNPTFVWNELMDGVKDMIWWTPTGDEEIALSERFYEVAMAIDWNTIGEEGVDGRLVGLPPREEEED